MTLGGRLPPGLKSRLERYSSGPYLVVAPFLAPSTRRRAVQIVAFSSAAFFSSMTPSGRPFTNRTMSGRRVCGVSETVNWFTAS